MLHYINSDSHLKIYWLGGLKVAAMKVEYLRETQGWQLSKEPIASFWMRNKTLLLLEKETGNVVKYKRSLKSDAFHTPKHYWNQIEQTKVPVVSLDKKAKFVDICADILSDFIVCSMFDEMNCCNILYIMHYDLEKAKKKNASMSRIILTNQPTPIFRSIIVGSKRNSILICCNYISTINILCFSKRRISNVKQNHSVTIDRIFGFKLIRDKSAVLYGSGKLLHTIIFSI